MSIAILCPGPSLPDVWCDDFQGQHSLIIAINTVGFHYESDWVAGSDNHIIRPFLIKTTQFSPRIGFICAGRWRGGVMALRKKWENPWLSSVVNCAKSVQQLSNSNTCGYTFPSTYAWAAQRGARIEVYGFDCAVDCLDFTGQTGDHSANRWKQELLWLQSVWKRGTVIHGKASRVVRDYLDRR